jgi:hypothetical protein
MDEIAFFISGLTEWNTDEADWVDGGGYNVNFVLVTKNLLRDEFKALTTSLKLIQRRSKARFLFHP